jgi:glutamyl-tRNA reductase
LEGLTFKDEEETMKNLFSLEFVKESVLIVTCNRIEIYTRIEGLELSTAVNELTGFWSKQVGVSRDVILGAADIFSGHEALYHLLSLAAGLESMVVGEDQILGQVRTAYVKSKDLGNVGKFFETLFMKAINVGRRIRNETFLNEGSLSISSIAVELAEKHVGDLASASVLLVGAGETGTIAGKELSSRNVKSIFVANRTYEKGAKLAEEISGRAVRFSKVFDLLPKVDIAIVAASTLKPIITLKRVMSTLSEYSNGQKLLIIDISQPRCVEETVGKLPYVELKNIDDLKTIAANNIKRRLGEVIKAKKIVTEEMGHLELLLKKIISEPTISSLCQKSEEIRRKELSKALRILKGINRKDLLVIDTLTKVLVERILQTPINCLRLAALNGDDGLLEATEKIFNLNSTSKKGAESAV